MSWRAHTIIRHKITGRPLLVLQSYKVGTVVVDLEDNRNPSPTLMLLERDYDNWVDEKRLACKEKKKDSWVDEPILSWGLAVAI